MTPISHKTLIRKSRNYRNEEAIKKLAINESLTEWSKTPPVPSPSFKKCDIIKESAGWYNLIATTLRELRP